MTVVCNSSPLINLAKIDSLDIIRQVYGSILIPAAVYHEVAGNSRKGAEDVNSAD
jgi:hypothetical protein